MSGKQQFGAWETFTYKRGEYNFNGHLNVKLVRNGETIAVAKTQKDLQGLDGFINEVQILAAMDHPNIVNVLEYDLKVETPYMITEFIKGGTIKDNDLSDWTIKERLNCFQQVCQAIAYVHDKGYQKIDIFRGNVFLREDKTPVIGDFERSKPIENTDHIADEMASLARLLWEMMHGENFGASMMEEKRINEKIFTLTSKIEELQEQKKRLQNPANR